MFHWLEKNYPSLLVQGIGLGASCLVAANASANPNTDFSCESLAPITNTVQPEELSGDEDGQTPSDMKVVPLPTPPTLPTLPTLSSQELATSFCAADLTGVTEATPDTQAPPEETSSPEVAPETETEVESEPVENKDGWRINIQPYATIPVTTYGEVTVKGRSVSYHQNLGELLEVLKVAVSGRIEAWKGNFGLIFDGYYVNLGGSGITQISRPFIDATLESNLSFDQGIYDFAVSYHIGDRPIPYQPDKPSPEKFPRVWFAPIAGTRLNDISSTIETTLTFNRLERNLEASASAGRTWFEPMLGGKVGVQISEPITLWARGDASGFGLAGEENLSWNAIFGADWWVRPNLSLQLAYRFYSIKYGNGSGDNAFLFEENFNGPYLSVTFSF